MIIDVHTHLGRNKNMTARVDDLLRSMDTAGIEKSFVFAGAVMGCSTDDMLKEIDPYHDRLSGVAAVELGSILSEGRLNQTYFDKLSRQIQDPRIIAAKFYLGYEHFYPDDEVVRYAMDLIASVGKTAIFHMGDCYRCIRNAKLKYAHPLGIDDVATDYPGTRIVIAHMGYPWQRDAAQVCYKNANVFSDVSGFVYGGFDATSLKQFKRVIDEFIDVAGSSDRLLFGSDWPISNQQSYVDSINEMGLMDQLQNNVTRVFTIDR